MKKETRIVLIGIAAVIILIGIILTFTIGFRVGLIYSKNKQMFISIGKQFEVNDIKQIVKEVTNTDDIIVEKVDLYKDIVAIRLADFTDEQKEQINTKINEKYEIENTVDNITVSENANVKVRDIIKPYIIPAICSVILSAIYVLGYLIYLSKSNKEVKVIKSLLGFVLSVVLLEGVLFSMIVICRIPLNRVTVPLAISTYVVASIIYTLKLVNKYTIVKKEEK